MKLTGKRILPIFATICLLIICLCSKGQGDGKLGGWNTVVIKGKLSRILGLMGEGNTRSNNLDYKYSYIEVKGGLILNIRKNLTGLAGLGFYNTYPSGVLFRLPALQKETRSWVELDFYQSFNRMKFEHRLRVEQRFLPDDYKNRLRYKLSLTFPVNKPQLTRGTFYFAFYDELFMPQYSQVLIDKNRFFGGGGYKMTDNTTFQIGCLSDTNYLTQLRSIKNYLQLVLIYDFTKLIKKHS